MFKLRWVLIIPIIIVSVLVLFLRPVSAEAPGTALLARSTVTGPNSSVFYGSAIDSSGNIYGVGYIYGNAEYDFGNGVTVTGNYTSNNVLILKYNSSGTPQWARSTVSALNSSRFQGISIDSSGNVYAVGYLTGNAEFDFGNGVTVTGNYTSSNAVIVKYSSSGTPQWARSTVTGPNNSVFNSSSTDSSGYIYAVGYIKGNAQYDFGSGVTVTGTYTVGNNVAIVKYNSSGTPQWARSTVTGSNVSIYNDSTTDSSGNIYTVGYITSNAQYDFGSSVTVTGNYTGANAVIVKYNSSGTPQWARSTVSALNVSYFNGSEIDSSGNIYTAGYTKSTDEYDFGSGATVSGGCIGNCNNALIVKYNSSGTPQWARSSVTASNASYFSSSTTDSAGNIYAVGYINGNSEFDFGSGVTVTGNYTGNNALVIGYNSSGTPQWARSTVTVPNTSSFNSSTTDSAGNIYAVGYITGNSEFDFGNSVTVTGAYTSSNIVFLKFAGEVILSSTNDNNSSSETILPDTGASF